ncbi:hypothetical protein BaRGS_00007774 [Batillaria attramentaria]|uniref:Uncharacterized protein n=1 Tax=Batillaria attramentaria TaxID=370345 RepID=A0ABD0LN74_9CAEN
MSPSDLGKLDHFISPTFRLKSAPLSFPRQLSSGLQCRVCLAGDPVPVIYEGRVSLFFFFFFTRTPHFFHVETVRQYSEFGWEQDTTSLIAAQIKRTGTNPLGL